MIKLRNRSLLPSRRARSMGASQARQAFEHLEGRLLLSASAGASGVDDVKLLEQTTRVASPLLDLYAATAAGRAADSLPQAELFNIDEQERVVVTVRADDVAAAAAALAGVGFEPIASFPELHFVDGYIPVASLPAVAEVPGAAALSVVPSYRPMTLAGSVPDQADFVMETDRVRATAPNNYDGTGQKIGVLSDSYNALGGAPAGVASGDLPAAGVTVVQDLAGGGLIDEGRAMAELIHDLAPDAGIGFATAFISEGSFANNIRALANPATYGAGVIVDDVVYFAEPMFQDGVIAQAIDEVVTTRNVNYFSSAGNQASRAYESTTFQTAADTLTRVGGATVAGTYYDFDPGAGADTRQRITVPNGAQVRLSLQWDDPFYTASSVDTDLDIFLINANTGFIAASAELNNLVNDTPSEIVTFTNSTGAALPMDIAIRRFAGPNSGRIKYVNYGSGTVTIDQFATNSPTLVPHAGATQGQGVAAVPYFSQTTPESFTSKGPQSVLFSPTGTPIALQTRNSPQITGVDGTNTTFFGSDTEGDGRPNFFGTSAAAPHVAAVAALVREANPGFTPAQVYTRLQTTADDITLTGAGFDTLTGNGLVNAFDAIFPTIVPAAVNFSDGLESGALSSAYETRSTGGGRILVTNTNTPFAGTNHLTLDTSFPINDPISGVGNQFNLNEVTLHLNLSGAGTKTLSFRQKESGDEDNAMPASFTNSSNTDGVALSVDGVNWFRIVSLTGAASSAAYTLNTFNLTTIAAAAGITLGSDTRIRFQQFDDFPFPSDGFAFDEISVTTSGVVSATPGTPDLVAATDTGSSSTDNITNRDNSAVAKNLQFSVSGTVAGATVSIYSSGTLIGTAIAAGTTTTVTTNGTTDLADGLRSITARQTEAGKTESPDSAALSVTVDTGAPTADVTDVSEPRTTAVGSINVVFNEAVTGFDFNDLTLTRNGGNVGLSASNNPTTGDGGVNWNIPNMTTPTNPSGTYVLTVLAAGVADVAGNAVASNASDTWVNSNALPTVTDVFVSGTAWNTAYKNSLVTNGTGDATYGYRIPAGDQTNELPWSNINQISVRFSENVNVAADDLALTGVNIPAYAMAAGGFTYDMFTFTATWTFTQAIPNDKVTINLDADAGTGVTDINTNQLDGEWTNPVSPATGADTFPSGNGTPGGDFLFNLRVLPGDINRDAAVNVFDFNVLKPNLTLTGVGVLGGDINGDNVVNIFDFNDFKTFLGKTTPA